MPAQKSKQQSRREIVTSARNSTLAFTFEIRGGRGAADDSLRSGDQRVTLHFEGWSKSEFEFVAQTMRKISLLVREVSGNLDRALLESLVAILMQQRAPTSTQFAEAKRTVLARAQVFASGEWVTAAQIAELAGFSVTNPSAQPNKWKRDGSIFAINHNGLNYFPLYGLNADEAFRPIKAMAGVLKMFGETKGPWALALWFASVNGYLGGKRPQDLLGKQPSKVLAAASSEIAEVANG
jgi:hypothetical protein